jgi:hypothetical protein
LVILGGAAWALSRRRRDDDFVETYDDEPELDRDSVEPRAIAREQPTIVAPSAFAWGNQSASVRQASDDGSDRRAGETWIERAYRGPSPANPSASLRNRLRRAAFFDKREREVAAGMAEPVDTGAGLPESAVEEREFA